MPRAMLFLVTLGLALPVQAYIGPGAGLGTIGTAVAFLVAVLLLVVGFVWYPLKRLLRGRNKAVEAETETASKETEEG